MIFAVIWKPLQLHDAKPPGAFGDTARSMKMKETTAGKGKAPMPKGKSGKKPKDKC